MDPQLLLVRVDRFLDFRNADELIEKCRDGLDAGARGVLVVFEPEAVLDSAGLGALIRTYRHVDRLNLGSRLSLVNRSDHVRTLLDITGLGDAIPQFETVEKAIDQMGEGR